MVEVLFSQYCVVDRHDGVRRDSLEKHLAW